MNPSLDSLFADYGRVDVVAIRYHGDVPWEFDPFYNANPQEIDQRYSYYSISQMPTTIIDGAAIPRTCFINEVQAEIDQDLALSSPIKLTATQNLIGDSCFVAVSIICEADPQADPLVLRAAVIEDSIYYEAPNGQTVLNAVFRSFLPGPEGIGFSISEAETLDYDLAFEIDPAWDAAGISTVVFVQNDNGKQVVQAASSRPSPPAWARYTAGLRGKAIVSGHEVGFPGEFINRGPEPDTFDVSVLSDLPGDWDVRYRVYGGTQLDGAVVLESDSSCTVELTIDSGLAPGTGYATVGLRSRRDTSFARAIDFFAVAGMCALIVDDDGGGGLEDYYQASLDSVGVLWGRWDRRIAEPTPDDLGMAEFVVWFTGEAAPTLDGDDRQAIATYLDGGGRLFLTGQDIGYALCDIISDEQSAEATTFYETYLHASYVMSNSNLFDLQGRAGDPVGSGLSISIEGGSGANNQSFPDVVDSIAPARIIFDYSDPAKHGGVRYDSGTYMVVYLSFGFEAISDAAARSLLISRIVEWFGQTGGITDLVRGPAISCYPNPAVSYARIVTAPVQGRGRGPVEIYDVLGRMVRRADLGNSDHFIWDLTDAAGRRASPGVYFVSVRTGEDVLAAKVILGP